MTSKRSHQLVSGFLVFTGVLLTTFIYIALKPANIDSRSLEASFAKMGGSNTLKEFLSNKENLRRDVARGLKTNNQTVQFAAANIAVYLFPELLPQKNFERQAAEDLWIGNQKAIEANPRAGRQHFEDMQATIWNYENPDRNEPKLSKYATMVIRIYDQLTAK